MKRLLSAGTILSAAAAAALFLSGCGDPDADFKSKVPTEAEAVVYLDGAAVIRNKTVEKELQKDKELEQKLAVFSLKKEDLASRFLLFGSFTGRWGGVVVKTSDGAAARLFNAILKGMKDKKEKFTESVSGKQRRVSLDRMILVLYHDNLLLLSMEKTQFEAYEKPGKNPLLADLRFKDMLSGALTVKLPQDRNMEMAIQMVPSIKKLDIVSFHAPASPDQFQLDIRLLFSDDKAPIEALAALNMSLGMVGRENPGILKNIDRKTEGKALLIGLNSAFFTEAAELSRKAAERAQESAGMNNLKQVGLGCMMYAYENSNDYPASLGVLVEKKYFPDYKVFIAPYDKTSVLSDGKSFTEKNASFAYLGKGINSAKLKMPSVTPIAFEKPWLKASGKIAVLYADGHVGMIPAKGAKTCAGFIAGQLDKVPSPEKEILLKNAAEVDALEGRGK